MAAKKTPKKTSSKSKKTNKPPVNKSAFIRDNANLPPAEIVAKAKKQGITLSIAMVYTILSEYRKKQGKAPSKSVAKVAPTSAKASAKASGSVEAQFVQAVLELGATRAEELFRSTVAKVRAIGGK